MPPPSGTADSAAHRPLPPRSESPTTRRTSMPEGSPPTRTVIEPARATVHVQRRTMIVLVLMQVVGTVGVGVRSEERRVGKEWRCRRRREEYSERERTREH